MARNNPQLTNMLNQLEAMTPEQQQKALNNAMSQMGISATQLKQFLGK